MTHQIGVAWLAAALLLRQQADDPSLDDTLRQACLRRSISTAYYAVEYDQKKGSGPGLIAMPLQCMQALAETFIGLQKAREAADYAFDQPLDALKADQALANAEAVISEWQLLSLDLKKQFAQLLLLRVMPNPR